MTDKCLRNIEIACILKSFLSSPYLMRGPGIHAKKSDLGSFMMKAQREQDVILHFKPEKVEGTRLRFLLSVKKDIPSQAGSFLINAGL